MPYWMTHPKHGTMPVYDTGAVDRAKVNGWSVLNVGDSPNRPRPTPAPTPAPIAAPVSAPSTPAQVNFDPQDEFPTKRKLGRPKKGE